MVPTNCIEHTIENVQTKIEQIYKMGKQKTIN